jgi:hypothetical protein
MAASGKEVEKELSDFVTCHGDSLWSGLNSIVANVWLLARWVRFADSCRLADMRSFIFMNLRAECWVRFQFAWVPSMRSLCEAVGDASALAQGSVDGGREDR